VSRQAGDNIDDTSAAAFEEDACERRSRSRDRRVVARGHAVEDWKSAESHAQRRPKPARAQAMAAGVFRRAFPAQPSASLALLRRVGAFVHAPTTPGQRDNLQVALERLTYPTRDPPASTSESTRIRTSEIRRSGIRRCT